MNSDQMTNETGITVSKHLPRELAENTKYSVDASLHYEVIDGHKVEDFKVEDFDPKNPSICFRDEQLDEDGEKTIYLDIIWALDAETAEAAQSSVVKQLPTAIPTPPGLKQVYTNVDGVYENITGRWVIEN